MSSTHANSSGSKIRKNILSVYPDISSRWGYAKLLCIMHTQATALSFQSASVRRATLVLIVLHLGYGRRGKLQHLQRMLRMLTRKNIRALASWLANSTHCRCGSYMCARPLQLRMVAFLPSGTSLLCWFTFCSSQSECSSSCLMSSLRR